MRPTLYIANGIVWIDLIPLGPVIAVSISPVRLSREQALELVPGRKARSLAQTFDFSKHNNEQGKK